MYSFFNDLFDRFHELHSDIIKALDKSPSEALDWVPGVEMNSIAVLVVHLTGAERYWIGTAINEPPERNREDEFQAKGLDIGELKALIKSADDYARQALSRIFFQDLGDTHRSPRNDKTYTTGWCVAHALEHTALHTGHIQLTIQIWENRGIDPGWTPKLIQ